MKGKKSSTAALRASKRRLRPISRIVSVGASDLRPLSRPLPDAEPSVQPPGAEKPAAAVAAPARAPEPQHGLAGVFDSLVKRFTIWIHIVMLLPIYALACLTLGVAAAPGVFLYQKLDAVSAHWNPVAHLLAQGTGVASGFFAFGFTLLFVAPALNFLLGARLRAWRGPYYSGQVLRWYVHNALIYLVRYTFLEFVTPTPLSILFYKMMGMKIGDGTQLNTTHISDASLITVGRNVTIGGSATIVAHYGMGGYLVISPVVIGDGATIGLKATIMGGVEIGEKAKLMPNSVVLPRTKIPAGETWGGVPARKIDLRKAE